MTDVIDEVLGLAPGDDIWEVRRTRPEVLEHLQGGYDALFADTPAAASGITLDERAAIALRVCLVARVDSLAAHYRERITDPSIREAGETGTASDPRLGTLVAFATLVAAQPRDSGKDQIDALFSVGLDVPQIITLSQLIAYVSFQLRVVQGLYMMGY